MDNVYQIIEVIEIGDPKTLDFKLVSSKHNPYDDADEKYLLPLHKNRSDAEMLLKYIQKIRPHQEYEIIEIKIV